MSNEVTMNDFLKEYDLRKFSNGDVVKGNILSINSNEIIVNINYMKDGIIPKDEFIYDMEEDLNNVAKIGDEINVMILTLNDGNGNLILSKRKLDIKEAWDKVKKAYKNNDSIEINLKEEIKGGLIGTYTNGLKVFMPASQSFAYKNNDLKSLIGEKVKVKVLEFDKDKNKIVVSKRLLDEEIIEENKEKLWNELSIGEKRKGKVVRLKSFGAFVDIGGLQGLVHINDLSWKRVTNPEEVVKIGDEVEVYVLSVDKDKNRLSLALKDLTNDPWKSVSKDIKVNSVVTGRVVKFIQVGAIIELKDGIEGLVHISEISEERVSKPSDVLTIGQNVKVKILDVNEINKRVSLSIKDAIETPQEDFSKYMDNEESTLGDLFGDKLKNIFK